MYGLDHMLNGRGSRQHHRDLVRWAQHEQLAREAKETQHSQEREINFSKIARWFARIVLDRNAHRNVDERVEVNRQGFA